MSIYDSNIKRDVDELSKLLSEVEATPHEFVNELNPKYQKFVTAIRTKPFLLLAGISGTGKSRIVREMAKACWPVGSEEYKAHKPKNFEMIQVKPNWHDSSELIGYISRINGERFIIGPFLRFVVKALHEPNIPYFLCLDEMNLAPVEQYFAEYLSVIETRKYDIAKKEILTDAIIDSEYFNKKYESNFDIFSELGLKKVNQTVFQHETNSVNPQTEKTTDEYERMDIVENLKKYGLKIPQNLIVIGTVNMDETTFSFSRKVLDRAMTIEMNEVNLHSGLEEKYEHIGYIAKQMIVADAVEGVDVYKTNKETCEKVLKYLQNVNDHLTGTPFKIAYRTRNEFLLYIVNNLAYTTDDNKNEVIAKALDEVTSMKILSRIEGDDSKVSKAFLNSLAQIIEDELKEIYELKDPNSKPIDRYISLQKLKEMEHRLESGYTSFWS